MPDRRRHRGPHPEDASLFRADRWPALRAACRELSWLLSHGYPSAGSLGLVGDRHRLVERQRIAVRRAACTDRALVDRHRRRLSVDALRGGEVVVDGFNVLVTVEAALAGGVLLRCRDGVLRDMASMHGSYRRVAETDRAVAACAGVLGAAGVERVRWLLDRPVSNSGRLAERLRTILPSHWPVEVVDDPDGRLVALPAGQVAATADAGILDRCAAWCDLAAASVAALEPAPRGGLVDFRS